LSSVAWEAEHLGRLFPALGAEHVAHGVQAIGALAGMMGGGRILGGRATVVPLRVAGCFGDGFGEVSDLNGGLAGAREKATEHARGVVAGAWGRPVAGGLTTRPAGPPPPRAAPRHRAAGGAVSP